MKRTFFMPTIMAQAITVLTVLRMMTKAQTSCGTGSINGKILYERLPNIQLKSFDEDVIRDTAPPFNVLEKCQDFCLRDRSSQNIVRECRSFDFQPGNRIATFNGDPQYEESTCYLSREQSRPDGIGELILAPNSVHFTEVCITSNKPERECPNRRYIFERHPRKRLKIPQAEIKEFLANNRSECEDRCLNEFTFVCRSAVFDSGMRSCILSRFTRRTHPEWFDDDPDSDYLENTCLPAAKRCDGLAVFIKQEKIRLGGPFEVDMFKNLTLEDCQAMCARAEKYLCRSIEYDDATKICTISEEDSISQKDEISAANSPTHNFYDLVCLDSPGGSEYPENYPTSMLLHNDIPETAFQRYRNSRLAGEHQSEISDRSLNECLQECLRQPSFECRSAEYSARMKSCKLSRLNQRDGIRVVYDADYDYFENFMLGNGDSNNAVAAGESGGGRYPQSQGGGRRPSPPRYPAREPPLTSGSRYPPIPPTGGGAIYNRRPLPPPLYEENDDYYPRRPLNPRPLPFNNDRRYSYRPPHPQRPLYPRIPPPRRYGDQFDGDQYSIDRYLPGIADNRHDNGYLGRNRINDRYQGGGGRIPYSSTYNDDNFDDLGGGGGGGDGRWYNRPSYMDRRPLGRPLDRPPPQLDRPSRYPITRPRPAIYSPGPDGPIYDNYIPAPLPPLGGGGGGGRPPSLSTRCEETDNFHQIGSRQRARKEFVRKSVFAASLLRCQQLCIEERQFMCRSFNFRDTPTYLDAENCELSDRDSRELEMGNSQYFDSTGNFEFYERNSARRLDDDCLDVSQVCNEEGMEFTLRTPEGFYGRIYAHGYYDRCYFRGNGGTVNVLRLSAGTQGSSYSSSSSSSDCGTQRFGDSMSNIVVVQFSDNVQTGRDKRFNLTCLFHGPGEAVVSSGFIGAGSSGSPIPIEYLPAENTLSSKVRLLILYEGRPTTTIAVGDPLTFRIEAQDGYNNNYATDIFATNVVARDPYTGRSVQLIDRFGCPVDYFVFPELDKGRNGGDTLEARFKAFKIPESNFLVFEATVRTCREGCPPAYCQTGTGRSEPSFGRRRRRSINENSTALQELTILIPSPESQILNKTDDAPSSIISSTNNNKAVEIEDEEYVREMIEVFDSRAEMPQARRSSSTFFSEPSPELVCLSAGEYHGLIGALFVLVAVLLTAALVAGLAYRKYWFIMRKNMLTVDRVSSTATTFSSSSPNTSYPATSRSSLGVSQGSKLFATNLQRNFAAANFPTSVMNKLSDPFDSAAGNGPGGLLFEDPSEPIYTDPSLFERSRSLRSIAVPKRRLLSEHN